MSNNATLEKMKEMRLLGMQAAFETAIRSTDGPSISSDELIALLIEAEWNNRHLRKTDRYLKAARFRYQASIDQVDLSTPRNLDKNMFIRLADCSFLERKENLLITGSTGTGKSYVASAIGHEACIRGHKACYYNCTKLFSLLKTEQAGGTYKRFIDKLARMDLLILDDFGLQPLDGPDRLALLEIIEDRHARKSTIIASQLPVANWYQMVGEKTIADAILDRLIHTAHRIELSGESMRKRRKN